MHISHWRFHNVNTRSRLTSSAGFSRLSHPRHSFSSRRRPLVACHDGFYNTSAGLERKYVSVLHPKVLVRTSTYSPDFLHSQSYPRRYGPPSPPPLPHTQHDPTHPCASNTAITDPAKESLATDDKLHVPNQHEMVPLTLHPSSDNVT